MRQLVEQRRLARVRVADQRDRAEVAAAARLALRCSRRRRDPQIALEPLDAPQQTPAVDLELRLAGTAGADAAALLAELRPRRAGAATGSAAARARPAPHRPGSSRAGRRCRGSARRDRRRRPRTALRGCVAATGESSSSKITTSMSSARRARAAPRPCPCRRRSRDQAFGGAAAPTAPVRRQQCRRTARARRATPRPLRPKRRRTGAHQQRALAQALEVDLGRGEPPALAAGFGAGGVIRSGGPVTRAAGRAA